MDDALDSSPHHDERPDVADPSAAPTPAADMTKAVRVYKYGVRCPVPEDKAAVNAQIRAGHNYRNDLIAIERARRAAIRALHLADPDFSALREELERAEVELARLVAIKMDHRVVVRSKKIDRPEDIAACAEATTKKNAIEARFHKLRRQIEKRPEVAAELLAIAERAHRLEIGARALTHAYWGTYLLHENDMKASKSSLGLRFLWDGSQPNDPVFLRWQDEGRIGVQFQNGVSFQDLFGSDTRVRCAPLPGDAYSHPSRSERDRRQRTRMQLRIGSTEKGRPIFATFHRVHLHRPVPDGAKIKWLVISKEIVGLRPRWSLMITFDAEPETVHAQRRRPRAKSGRVGIDIGWRTMDDGTTRVVVWRGDDGRSGEFRLQPELMDLIHTCEDIASIRDKHLNAAMGSLIAWLDAESARGPLPAWMTDRIKHVRLWKGKTKLTRLVELWRQNRVSGDAAIFPVLDAWARKENHLHRYEDNRREHYLDARRERFRLFALQLSSEYREVVLENFRLPDVAKRPDTEDERSERARAKRVKAAIGIMRNIIAQAFNTVFKVDPKNTTKKCFACGSLESFDQARYLEHVCSSCHTCWDQDENAAKNILALDPDAPAKPRRKTRKELRDEGKRAAKARKAAGQP